jgi:hypothetical protein
VDSFTLKRVGDDDPDTPFLRSAQINQKRSLADTNRHFCVHI